MTERYNARDYAAIGDSVRDTVHMLKMQLESAQQNNNQLRVRIDALAKELRNLWEVRDWLLNNGYDDLFEAAKVAILLEKANETIK